MGFLTEAVQRKWNPWVLLHLCVMIFLFTLGVILAKPTASAKNCSSSTQAVSSGWTQVVHSQLTDPSYKRVISSWSLQKGRTKPMANY